MSSLLPDSFLCYSQVHILPTLLFRNTCIRTGVRIGSRRAHNLTQQRSSSRMVGTLLQEDQQPPCSSALTRSIRNSAHVARLFPTDMQSAQLETQGHTARAVWNLLHEWYTWGGHGRRSSRRPSVAEIDRQLRAARIDPLPGWEWLAKLPAQATQQVVKHYLRAWDRFFEGSARPPRFKRRAYARVQNFPSWRRSDQCARRVFVTDCADCGQVAVDSRKNRDWFRCVACGHQAPADANAARVLLWRGLAALNGTAPGHGVAGRGAFAVGQAAKRQPTTGAVA